MIRNESPCLDCGDRHIGCHDRCERYISFRTELDRINDEAFKLSEHESRLIAYERARSRRLKRSRK